MAKGKDIDTKVDELAQMVARGFMELQKGMKEEFANVRADMATKEELEELRQEMATKEDLTQLKGDFDIMLDKHIGIFRKDYDNLARRTKDLEVAVLK
ncbi:MAG: hypothetical protein Q7S95_02070 [bacterium]|nr:hypothetical protein [bacterium]